ncbi:MAG: cation:proton antiporter [Candidatus Mcinerneyibacterium aminivorans]|uniref:Cation:proton antiporter n=1 Tax=Candidatus Mcinerneyibacterium aminivorans TaxID=2703815 RepID=A0A5D0MFD2_9BACT|nr:MAG: cation:proton antiporter [Candidatus Mcinerneyibacterium aminivorans]
MKKRLRWILGSVVLIIILYLILFYPFQILIYEKLLFIPVLKRVIFILLLSAAFCLFRIMKGPTALDRIVAIDILGILIVGLCSVLTITTGRSWYLDIGIAWALQSFIGTIALSKYMEGRDFDD